MKTHWKIAFDSPYLGSWDLDDYQDLNLIIKEVKKETTEGLKQNETKNVCYFENANYKPMLLNAGNSKLIKKLSNSPYIEDWKGVEITLYVKEVKAFGELHDALRIRSVTKIIKKPVLDEKSPKWETAKAKVKEGMSYDAICKHYEITKANYKKLQA